MTITEKQLTRDAACLIFYEQNKRFSHVKSITVSYERDHQLEALEAEVSFLKQNKSYLRYA